MAIHTNFRKHQRIQFIMKDGNNFNDKYIGQKSGSILTKHHGRVNNKDIRATVIFRHQAK